MKYSGLTAFKTSIIGLPDRSRKAALRRHPGYNQVCDCPGLQVMQESGVPERALARLVDDHFTRKRFQFVDDIVAVFAPDEQSPQLSLVAYHMGMLGIPGRSNLSNTFG